MESINIEGTKISPRINFDSEKGIIELEGRSLPEQAHDLYKPLIKWIDDYKLSPKAKTTVNFKLEYINSSSNKYILQILKKIDDLAIQGVPVQINWFYDEEDDDLLETAEEYNELLNSEIKIIAVKEL